MNARGCCLLVGFALMSSACSHGSAAKSDDAPPPKQAEADNAPGHHPRGWFPSDAAFDEEEKYALQQRVAFDLSCKDVQYMKLGGKVHITRLMTRQAWGVMGCNNKVSYQVECVSNYGNVQCTPTLDAATRSSSAG